jgi:hypothetical protein
MTRRNGASIGSVTALRKRATGTNGESERNGNQLRMARAIRIKTYSCAMRQRGLPLSESMV